MGNRKSPSITPPLRARRLDAPRSPGVRGVCMRKGNVVEGSGVDVVRGPRVQAMEFHYDIRRVDVAMYYPRVVADVIALPFDKVLQAVRVHARVQYGLYLMFLFAFYQDRRGWGSRMLADDGVRSCQSELEEGKDRMWWGKAWRELQTVCAVANASLDRIGAQTAVGELYRRPIGGDVSGIDPYRIARL